MFWLFHSNHCLGQQQLYPSQIIHYCPSRGCCRSLNRPGNCTIVSETESGCSMHHISPCTTFTKLQSLLFCRNAFSWSGVSISHYIIYWRNFTSLICHRIVTADWGFPLATLYSTGKASHLRTICKNYEKYTTIFGTILLWCTPWYVKVHTCTLEVILIPKPFVFCICFIGNGWEWEFCTNDCLTVVHGTVVWSCQPLHTTTWEESCWPWLSLPFTRVWRSLLTYMYRD